MQDLPLALQKRLAQHQRQTRAEWDARPAAVLVPLFLQEGQWHVLFTQRTEAVETHRGQVSFPGGLIEPQDEGPEQAALREAEEEVGLRPEDVQVLGTLDSLLTVTQFHITPVVGAIPWPYPLRPNRAEVAATFGVPVSWLADPSNLEIRQRRPMVSGPSVPVYYFRSYQGQVIWGATARITLNLMELMGPLLK
jgi:8-oxo-dGTP pyrophosphatase MutT (NUDIX family)